MAVNCSPFGPKPQLELSDGLPAVGNQLFFYVAGSVNTKQNTYTDSTGGSANPNPIVLNSLGEPTDEIWFTAGLSYKVVYAPANDTDPPTSPIWTIDNLVGINDTTVSQDQWVSFAGAPTYISATSFSLVGDQTTTFQVGRRIKTTNTGGTVYSTITASSFGVITTITVVNDSSTLDSGLSAVSYGLLSKSNDSMPRQIFPTMAQIKGFISGLTYANNAGDPTNDIDIAAGAAIDTTGADVMVLASTLTKQLDAAWAVGNNQGGILSGAAANVDYNIWQIKRVDTQVVDVGFETTANATPTLPANYTLYRKIGWFKRVGGTIVAFHTYESEGGGIEMNWDAPTLDVNLANTLTTARRTDAVKVPLNFSVEAHLSVVLSDAATAGVAWICCPDQTDAAPSGVAAPLANANFNTIGGSNTHDLWIRTNSAGLIAARATLATVDLYNVSTMGFRWSRK